MKKYSTEFKMKIVQEYLNEEGGYKYLTDKYGLSDHSVVRRWVNSYKTQGYEGLKISRKNNSYSFEFKKNVVKLYLTGEMSYQELSNQFKINNPAIIARWVINFRNQGLDGLRPKKRGRLPVHVRCLLDEFANIGLIPKFEKLIATIRSREISASIILQAQSQLKAIYKDHADTIVGNCDSTLFLGGKEKTTVKELSETLGKETIDLYNTSETRSNQKSFGLNYQKTGKELMSQDEITVMDGGKCIYQLRGVRPFLYDKFDITKHKNYKLFEDYDKKNLFDIEKYLQRKGKVRLNGNMIIHTLK